MGQRISALQCIKNYAVGCVNLILHLYYARYAEFIFELLLKKKIKYSNTQAVSCDLVTFQFVKKKENSSHDRLSIRLLKDSDFKLSVMTACCLEYFWDRECV